MPVGRLAEKRRLATRLIDAEMLVSQRRRHAAARRAVEQAKLHQVRLVDFFDGVFFLAERRGNRIQARPGRRNISE